MGAVLLRARAELRGRLRAWLGLALLAGLVAGIVIAAAAGARRTDGVYDRFLEAQRAADVLVDNYPDPGVTVIDPGAIERLPQVESAARAAYGFLGRSPNFAGSLAPADAGLGREINRLKLVEGRLPDPRRVEEIAVGFERARQFGWELGTTMPLIERRFAAKAAGRGIRNVRFRVVGIVAGPGEFPPLERGGPSVYHTRAFYRAYAETPIIEEAGQAVLARLEHGAADVPAFRRALERLAGGEPVSVSVQATHAADVERSLELQVAALWLFAGLIGFTGIVVLTQALSRQAFVEADEHATLHALGMTRRQLWYLGLIRALAIGAIAALVAVALAAALSPLTPIGALARTAEPDSGVAIDATAFAVGAVATIVTTVLLAAPAAWLAARGPFGARSRAGARSRLASALAHLGVRPSMLTGVRMALEPGHGRGAVPVRTAILGTTVGIAALAATFTFGASSAHLLDTPRLYGWNWDLVLTHDGAGPNLAGPAGSALARDPAIEGASVADLGAVEIQERPVDAIGVKRLRGSVLPPLIEGRAPAGSGEILLGTRTMRVLDVELGGTVAVGRGERSARMRVVGRTVLPAIVGNTGRLGEGAVLSYRDVRRLDPGETAGVALVRLAAGADREALIRRLGAGLGTYAPPVEEPLEIVDFGQMRELPLGLSAALGLLAAATLVHVLVSTVRRRRRDLAVLKTLGFVRGEIRGVVLTQSITHAVVALVVGLPLGVLLGRIAWNLFAEWQGIVAEVVVPVTGVLLTIPGALILAAALALLPAKRAARSRPADVLRVE